MPFGESSAEALAARNGAGLQPYKYGGKEEVTLSSLTFLDFHARPYDTALARFLTPDLLREKYTGFDSHLYCVANPVNFTDPTGMAIRAISSDCQKMILNTIPESARGNISFGQDGIMSISLDNISTHILESKNMSKIVSMALDEKNTLDVFISDGFNYENQQTGDIMSADFGEIQTDDEKPDGFSIDVSSNKEDMYPRTGEYGWYGTFVPSEKGGYKRSLSGHSEVYINSNLSEEGKAQAFSHEGLGHAFLYFINGNDIKKASHNTVGIKELNSTLSTTIHRSINETIKNMSK